MDEKEYDLIKLTGVKDVKEAVMVSKRHSAYVICSCSYCQKPTPEECQMAIAVHEVGGMDGFFFDPRRLEWAFGGYALRLKDQGIEWFGKKKDANAMMTRIFQTFPEQKCPWGDKTLSSQDEHWLPKGVTLEQALAKVNPGWAPQKFWNHSNVTGYKPNEIAARITIDDKAAYLRGFYGSQDGKLTIEFFDSRDSAVSKTPTMTFKSDARLRPGETKTESMWKAMLDAVDVKFTFPYDVSECFADGDVTEIAKSDVEFD